MAATPDIDWAAQLAAVEAWWRGAGVDQPLCDEPTDWLADPRKPPPDDPPAPAKGRPALDEAAPPVWRIGGERHRWPSELGPFADWWLTEPSLDPVPGARRVPPAGPKGAPLMVLVPQPEPDDRETLLGGAQGRLLDAILAAFGLSRSRVYLASALPRATPLADWSELARNGMGEVLAHHVSLAAPERLLVFGRSGVSALLGHDPAQPAAASLDFAPSGGSIPLAFAPALETLLERPARKAGVWARWLEWTGAE